MQSHRRNPAGLFCFSSAVLIFLFTITAGCTRNVRMESVPLPAEVIDMNRIRLYPVPLGDGTAIKVLYLEKNSKKQPYLRMNLNYKEAGLNLIEAIKDGDILFHRIIVRNEKGQLLGQSTINFTAVNIKSTTITKEEQSMVITDSMNEIEVGESVKEGTVVRKEYSLKTFTDEDNVPQTIPLKTVPKTGSYINVYIEIAYLRPYLHELCPVEEKDSCPAATDLAMRTVREENKQVLDEIIEKYKKGEEGPFRFEPARSADHYRQAVRKTVDEINQSSDKPPEGMRVQDVNGNPEKTYTNIASFGSRLYYREWKLVSPPAYFKIVSDP